MRKSCKKAALAKRKAGTQSKTNLSLGKCNITTGLFVSFTLLEKRQICKFSQKVPVSFSHRIAEVTKALRKKLTWRAGPAPTVLTTIHANILCFCYLSQCPLRLWLSRNASIHTQRWSEASGKHLRLPADILYS